MKKLIDIVNGLDFNASQNVANLEVASLVFDSRKANENALFFAIVGFTNNGHQFVQDVYNRGCRAFVVQENIYLPSDALVISVKDTSFALGVAACNFYDNPSHKLTLVGVTGTNGKTTTTTLLHKLFMGIGYQTGLISTVVNKIGETQIPSTHTTPDPVSLNALLHQMVE